MKKGKLKILTIASSIISVVTGVSLPLVINSKNQNFLSVGKNINNNDDFNNEMLRKNSDKSKELVPFDFNESWPLLVQNTGPIVSYQNKISSLDWFSSTRWSIDLLQATFEDKKIFGDSPRFVKWTDRAFINWALDRNKNILWLLTNSVVKGSNVEKQKFIKIDSLNGKILDVKELAYKPKNQNWMYYSISVLDSGNIMAYGQGNDNWEQFDILDTKKGEVNQKSSASGNIDKLIEEDIRKQKTKGDVRSRFLFSIAKNMNILVLTNFGWSEKSQDKKDFGDIYFAFVDDDMNRIQTGANDDWFNARKMIERTKMGNLNSESDTFPKLVYRLPDGRILFSIYNKLYVFFPSETERQNKPVFKEFDYGVKDNASNKYLPVESWTTDTDNNVYAKFSNDSKIQKITIHGNSLSTTSITTSTYYNIDGNNDRTIKKNANNFVLYNVYGYSGQIMMLNPRKINNKQNMKPWKQDDLNRNGTGIAVAITKNRNGVGGDSKGYLNTDKAFVKSADFNIDESILKNKLPSEIGRNDLTITEGGFLTNNNTIDKKTQQLKYKQFQKNKIDDENKNNSNNLEITANIDQIPWFVDNNVMPGNIPPLTITKSFKTGVKISERITWKNVELDYDFKNTFPSKITKEDVQRFDPFSINITSQITKVAGVSYPRKTYEIGNINDDEGTILIKAKFEYLPIDVDATMTNIKTQTFEKTYNVFKKNSPKNFNFVGSNGNNREDIKNIPQLKNLSQANLLPSSFQASDPSSILKFINTDTSTGYPISKMNFTITPNDNLGTLTISGSLPLGYYPDSENQTFSKTYIGLNKISDYNFNVRKNSLSFIKKNFRPSEINEQIVYANFIDYKGFNSSDLSLDLIPNDEIGELIIRVHLKSDYPNNIATQSSFRKNKGDFIRETKITGFKTNDEYKTQYELSFVNDNNHILDEIKKFTPKQIEQSIKIKENVESNFKLVINGQNITNEQQLAKAVIEKMGSSLPRKSDLNDENFEQEIYYNDPNGEITIKITFKNIEGVKGNLVFIQRFTGFAKGNQVTTNDILSFKTQSKLMNDNPNFKNTLPSQLAKLLNNNEKRIDEIKKYISYFSGDYIKAINLNKFNLEITPSDVYGYLTIKIIFDKEMVKNPDSLLTYTATYNGFATE
ncbi:lipoprotein 17-related variable surface protein [Malacoplasma iowae]|uniref:lipoprotein 17-related variable surface protein n=1 Tax=Malacoplasma iowae TaxID=2116 RepID=UPI002A1886F9|nr:lipoprotein 17-related variable surface protein [Malacoplasma iowae]WPL36378.1 lipoprotein 17-related variable surface protein [Malacoplasma iowae]WPL37458.1 lipoprotein 17-related variable surface protein [Malacoplasma iowae]